jgi:hypothetical protein
MEEEPENTLVLRRATEACKTLDSLRYKLHSLQKKIAKARIHPSASTINRDPVVRTQLSLLFPFSRYRFDKQRRTRTVNTNTTFLFYLCFLYGTLIEKNYIDAGPSDDRLIERGVYSPVPNIDTSLSNRRTYPRASADTNYFYSTNNYPGTTEPWGKFSTSSNGRRSLLKYSIKITTPFNAN